MQIGLTLAVLRGGKANERDVSLRSGAAVLEGLKDANYTVEDWSINDVAEVIELVKNAPRPLLVFNVLHGRGGEDGQVQALLDVLGVPYTGSGMLASAVSMDKAVTKRIWQSMGLPTAEYFVVNQSSVAQFDPTSVRYPVMVKPVREGSSIGMFKVDSAQTMMSALEQALSFDDQVLVESWIDGDEYTVAILGNQALPMIRLKTPNQFYDYDAKYHSNTTEYLCPCGLSAADEQAIQSLALKAFNAVGARTWGRIDVMIDRQHNPWLLEINTVPGMTDHSLVPMAAAHAGMSFSQLVDQLVRLSQ